MAPDPSGTSVPKNQINPPANEPPANKASGGTAGWHDHNARAKSQQPQHTRMMKMTTPAGQAMPQYQSHKVVWAIEIAAAEPGASEGTTKITPKDSYYTPFEVPNEVVARYAPEPGDFFLTYADGYQSISPAKAFTEGYTPVT
jgi:hypothetical protein